MKNNNTKHKKINKEIQKKITQIIFEKFFHILGKKNIINISKIFLSKNLSFINVYINFIFNINKKNINKKLKILQKSEKKIKNILKKKTLFKFIPKIYFKYDNFYIKQNNFYNLIKKINKNNKIKKK